LYLNKKAKIGILNLLYGLGYGITLHGIANELWRKGGIPEVLSLQGEYIGFIIMMLSWILLNYYLIWSDTKCPLKSKK